MSLAAIMVHPELRAALRQRLLTLMLCQTGVLNDVSADAASNSLVRVAGSFLTDGFSPGDEVVVSGFTTAGNNGRALIVSVDATHMKLNKALTLTDEAAGDPVQIKAGAPQNRVWENEINSPNKGEPYVSESFRPLDDVVRSIGGDTQQHLISATFTFRYPANTGTLAGERMAAGALQLFKPRTVLNYGNSRAVIRKARRIPMLQDPDWAGFPVDLTLSAFTSN